MKKILITGGHVTPAIAVIEKLMKDERVEIVFVGRRFINEYEKTETFEYQEVTRMGVRFIHLNTGRFSTELSFKSLKRLLLSVSAFFKARDILKKEKPDLILSFGGYIALPVAYAAHFMNIPLFTHEQTIRPGKANKLIARVARTVFVSFEENKKDFPGSHVVVTGNPVRKSVTKVMKKPFEVPATEPVIYITGGSLGAHSINILIEEKLEELLSRYVLIHQTGDVKEYGDYERLVKKREGLSSNLKERYILAPNFYDDEIGYVYNRSDVVMSRAGANTFFELVTLKKPAVLIPLPWSANGEQEEHAKLYEHLGLGVVFNQNSTAKELVETVDKVYSSREDYRKNFSNIPGIVNGNAAETIIQNLSI